MVLKGSNPAPCYRQILLLHSNFIAVPLTMCYVGTKITLMNTQVERVQTGVRLEKRLLKVLKGTAEHLDMSLGDLLEGMALHCFENRTPFSPETLGKIEQLKSVYDLDLRAADAHTFQEKGSA